MKPDIEKVPVESSNLESVGYYPDYKILEITFKSGESYLYLGVMPETYEALLEAPSKGKFFHVNIKNQFSFVKAANYDWGEEDGDGED